MSEVFKLIFLRSFRCELIFGRFFVLHSTCIILIWKLELRQSHFLQKGHGTPKGQAERRTSRFLCPPLFVDQRPVPMSCCTCKHLVCLSAVVCCALSTFDTGALVTPTIFKGMFSRRARAHPKSTATFVRPQPRPISSSQKQV